MYNIKVDFKDGVCGLYSFRSRCGPMTDFWFHKMRWIFLSMYICRFQNVFLRCPTPRLHRFLSSHWPSFRFLSFMVFLIPSIQFFFSLPRALFCFGIHFNAILGNLPSAILWTWPYHVSWFRSISFIIVSSNPICYLIVTFLIVCFLDNWVVTRWQWLFYVYTKYGPYRVSSVGRSGPVTPLCLLWLQFQRETSR